LFQIAFCEENCSRGGTVGYRCLAYNKYMHIVEKRGGWMVRKTYKNICFSYSLDIFY
jgi:hypothetical protein